MTIIFLNDIQFSSRSDVVNGSLLTPPESLYLGPVENGSPAPGSGSPVNTGAGNDKLNGRMDDNSSNYSIIFPGSIAGVLLKGGLDLGAGNDGLKGEAYTNSGKLAVYGITLQLSGAINAAAGNDKVEGVAHSASESSTQVVGIVIGSTDGSQSIDMGSGGPGASKKGNDTVIGLASGQARSVKTDFDPLMAGIFLARSGSSIRTHEGNDTVTGIANAVGESPSSLCGIILNSATTIETGAGNDKVIAKATLNGATVNGFRGSGIVDLGADNDVLEGFGGITAKGGLGKDAWDLSAYNKSDFTIAKFDADGATFTKSGITANADGFETFIFADGTFNYASL
jgi:hypothetical protein